MYTSVSRSWEVDVNIRNGRKKRKWMSKSVSQINEMDVDICFRKNKKKSNETDVDIRFRNL